MMSGSLQGRSILVVEDEPLLNLSVSSLLKREGARVHSARTVEQALRVLQKHDFWAVLLDINLGKTDCSEIYETCVERGVTVVLHTGYTPEYANPTRRGPRRS